MTTKRKKSGRMTESKTDVDGEQEKRKEKGVERLDQTMINKKEEEKRVNGRIGVKGIGSRVKRQGRKTKEK